MKLEKLIENGGATLNANLQPMYFVSGYQVSEKDILTIAIDELNQAKPDIILSLVTLSEGQYIGLWVNEGKLYVDKSIHVPTLKKALAMGKKLNQKAILRWSDFESIYIQ